MKIADVHTGAYTNSEKCWWGFFCMEPKTAGRGSIRVSNVVIAQLLAVEEALKELSNLEGLEGIVINHTCDILNKSFRDLRLSEEEKRMYGKHLGKISEGVMGLILKDIQVNLKYGILSGFVKVKMKEVLSNPNYKL